MYVFTCVFELRLHIIYTHSAYVYSVRKGNVWKSLYQVQVSSGVCKGLPRFPPAPTAPAQGTAHPPAPLGGEEVEESGMKE